METKLEQGSSEEAKWVKLKKISSQLEFWIASHGSYKASHILFRSLGNQDSTTSNGSQIRVETKTLWSIEASCARGTFYFKST